MNRNEKEALTLMYEELLQGHEIIIKAINQISKPTSKISIKDQEKPRSDDDLTKLLKGNESLYNTVLSEVRSIKTHIKAGKEIQNKQNKQNKQNEKTYSFNFKNTHFVYMLGVILALLLLSIGFNIKQYKQLSNIKAINIEKFR